MILFPSFEAPLVDEKELIVCNFIILNPFGEMTFKYKICQLLIFSGSLRSRKSPGVSSFVFVTLAFEEHIRSFLVGNFLIFYYFLLSFIRFVALAFFRRRIVGFLGIIFILFLFRIFIELIRLVLFTTFVHVGVHAAVGAAPQLDEGYLALVADANVLEGVV